MPCWAAVGAFLPAALGRPRCCFLRRGRWWSAPHAAVPARGATAAAGPPPDALFSSLFLSLPFCFLPACGAAWAGKAGWWCYPWFWDSQSKMTLPISPTCNPLGRSRTSRTLRGTRGMSKEEGSPAAGGDQGLTQGGGGGGGRPRGAPRLERPGSGHGDVCRRRQLSSPLERRRRADPDPFLPLLPSPPSLRPSPSSSPPAPCCLHAGGALGAAVAPSRAETPCQEKGERAGSGHGAARLAGTPQHLGS